MNAKFKKCGLILFILMCVGVICYGGYLLYLNINTTPPQSESPTQPGEEEPHVLRVRIAYLADSDFELCEENGALLLLHKGNETKFDWVGTFNSNTVQMNYADYNGDGQNELAIVTTLTNEDKTTTNELHLLTVLENGNEILYRDTSFNSNSFRWKAEGGEIVCAQTENLQRVSVTLNGQTSYFRVPLKTDGGYETFEQLDYGNCTFRLTPGSGEVQATVEAVAKFADNKERHVPGKINAKLVYKEEQYLYTEPSFTPDSKWGIAPPPTVDPTPFSLKVHNADPKVSTGRILSNIEFTLESERISTHNFENSQTDERYLTDIIVTESSITLVLPTMMFFNDTVLTTLSPQVWLGGEDGYYIHGATTLTSKEDGYHLTTTFTEKIGRSDFTKLTYHCGE